MRYRKYLGWGIVLCVGLGLVLVLVSLWVQPARQPSLEERIAEAKRRWMEHSERTRQVIDANPPVETSVGWKTEEEKEGLPACAGGESCAGGGHPPSRK
jgi:hypothetical protein